MTRIQVIERDGAPAFVVLPIELWERVRGLVEDAEDAAALEQAVRDDDGARVPLAVVKAEMEGAHPVRAWRGYRGLSQEALAAAAGVSKPFISQIEGRKRSGTAATLKKLAKALNVQMEALLGA